MLKLDFEQVAQSEWGPETIPFMQMVITIMMEDED